MDTRGFQPTFTITNAITANLTRIERARGFLEAARLSEEWMRSMEDRAFVLEAHHTTHIEGTQLTLHQAERLLAGEAVPEADPDDARELLNYRRAFELVSEYLDSGAAITEPLVREIHKRLVEGVRGGKAAPGRYRGIQNYVVNSGTGEIVYTVKRYESEKVSAGDGSWRHATVRLVPVNAEFEPIILEDVEEAEVAVIAEFVEEGPLRSRMWCSEFARGARGERPKTDALRGSAYGGSRAGPRSDLRTHRGSRRSGTGGSRAG